MQGFAGGKIETGMMQRAMHRAVRQEPVRQGAVIMGAEGIQGVELAALAHQKHRLAADMALQHGAILEIGGWQSRRQIRPDRFVIIRHIRTFFPGPARA